MHGLFTFLTTITFLALIVGLIMPSWVKMPSRKRAGLVFGGAWIICFILFGITTPQTPSTTAAPQQNKLPPITDAQYLDGLQANVLLMLQAAQKDTIDPTLAVFGGQYLESLDATSTTKAQGEYAEAQTNFSSLHNQAPSDLSQADGLLNQSLNEQVNGINAVIAAVNAAIPKGGFSYLDPDATYQGLASLEQGATDENQALSLIVASNAASSSEVSAIKKEQQTLTNIVSYFQGIGNALKVQQTLKSDVQNTISKLGGGIQASYQDLRIESADPDRPAGTTMITVFVGTGQVLDKSTLLDTANQLSAQLFQNVFSSGINAYDVFIDYQGQTTDEYGNTNNNTTILVDGMDKNTYAKINWSGFDWTTLCNFLKSQGTAEGGTGSDACNTLVNIQ